MSTAKSKPRFRRRRFFRKKPTAYTAVKMVRRLRRHVNRNEELKNKDNIIVPGTVITSAGSVLYITNIAQGNNEINRTGKRITLHSVLVRISVFPNSTNPAGNNLRFMIVQDRNNVGSTPGVSDVLQQLSSTAPLLSTATMRFRVICDRLYSVIAGQVVNDKLYCKLEYRRNILNPIQYTGTADTDGSAGSGALFIMMVSDEATNGPVVHVNARTRFKDD